VGIIPHLRRKIATAAAIDSPRAQGLRLERTGASKAELLCLGAGQQHAVVQCMEKSLLGNPSLLLDKDAMHDADLGQNSGAQLVPRCACSLSMTDTAHA
jgi:hypothetical protein